MFSINSLSLFLCCLLSFRDSHQQQIQNSFCARMVEASENSQLVCREVCDNKSEDGDYYDFRIVNDGECYRKCNITKTANENNHERRKMETKGAETPSSDVTESSTTGSFAEETTQAGTSSGTVSVPVSMLSVPNNSIRTVEPTQQQARATEQATSTDSQDTRLPFTSLTESSKSMITNVSIRSSTRFDANTTEMETETNIATRLEDTKSKKTIFDSREKSNLVTLEDSVTTFYTSLASTNLDSQPTRESATGQPTTQNLTPMRTGLYSIKLPIADELITSEKDETGDVTSTVFPSHESTLPVVTSIPRETKMPISELQPVTENVTPMIVPITEHDKISGPVTTLSIPNESNYKTEEGITVKESPTDKLTKDKDKDTDEDTDKDKLTEISTVEHTRSTRPLFPTTETDVSATEQTVTTPSIDVKSETITTDDSPTVLTTLPKDSSPVQKLPLRVSSALTVSPTESSNQVYSTDETRLTEQASVKKTTTTTVSFNPSKSHHMLHPPVLSTAKTSQAANTVSKLQPTSSSFTEKATSLETGATDSTFPEVTETSLGSTSAGTPTNTSPVTLIDLKTQKDIKAKTSPKLLEITTSSGGTANTTPVSFSEACETETQITQASLSDKLIQTIAFTTDQTVVAETKIPTTEKSSSSFLFRQEILSTKTSQPPTERVPTTTEKTATHRRHLSELGTTTQSESTSLTAEVGFKTESIISTVDSTTESTATTVLLFALTESEMPTTEQPDKTMPSINTTENRLSTVALVSSSVTSQQTPMNTNLSRQETETTSKTESTKLAESIIETTSPIVATEPKTLGDRYIEPASLTDTIENQQATTPVFSTTTPSQTETNYISKSTELTTALNQSSIIPIMSTTVQTLPKIQTNYANKTSKLTTIDKQSSTIPVLLTTVQTPSKIQTKHINNTETTKPIIMDVSEPQTTTIELPIVETFVDEAPATEKSSQTSTYTTTLRQTDGSTPMDTVLLWTKTNRELTPVTETSVRSHLTLATVQSIETLVETLPSILPQTKIPHKSEYETNSPSAIPSSLTQPAITDGRLTTKSPFRSRILPALMRSVISRIITKPTDYSRPLHSLIRSLIIKLFTKSPEPTTVGRKLSTPSTTQTPTDTTVTTTESFVPTTKQTMTTLSVDPVTETMITESANSSTVLVVPTKLPGIVSIISQLHHCAKYPCIRSQNRHPHSQLARLHQHQNKVVPVVTTIHHPGDRKLNNCHSHNRLSGIHGLQHCISQPDPESNKDVHLIPSNEDNHRQQEALQRLKQLDLLHEPRRHQNISDKNVTGKINRNHSKLNNESNQNDKSSQIHKSIPLHALHPQRPQIPEKEPQHLQCALHNMNRSQQLNDSNYTDKSPQSQQSAPLHKLHPQRTEYHTDEKEPPQHVLHSLIDSHKPEIRKLNRPHQHHASEFTNKLHNLHDQHRLGRLHQDSGSHNVHRTTPDHRLDRLNRFPQRQRQNPQSFPNSPRRQMNPFQRQNLQNLRKQYLYTS